jgi:tRNA U34 2-thiouridine synthase MnmA/TrmU
VLDKDAATNRVVVGSADELRTSLVALRDVRLHRAGREIDRVKLRYRAKPLAAKLVGDPPACRHTELELELADPADAAAPCQLACLMRGGTVIGWGTIARLHSVGA